MFVSDKVAEPLATFIDYGIRTDRIFSDQPDISDSQEHTTKFLHFLMSILEITILIQNNLF